MTDWQRIAVEKKRPPAPPLSEAAREEIRKVSARYPVKRSAVIHGLRLVQREHGYLSREGMVEVARLLEINPHQVWEVATFYTMFSVEPTGRFVLQVCKTLPCALRGALDIAAYLEKRLGIRVGETTADGLFTLRTVECLASCNTAPVIQVNEEPYCENLSPAAVDRLIAELRVRAAGADDGNGTGRAPGRAEGEQSGRAEGEQSGRAEGEQSDEPVRKNTV